MVAVKLMKWSPWPSVAKTRKFKVKVNPIKFQGFNFSGIEDDVNEKIVAIKVKWKGEQPQGIGLVPFGRKKRNEFSSEKILKQGQDSESYVDWDDEGFENTCDFIGRGRDQKLDPWDISFTILYGEKKTKSKAKLRRIGEACINIAEMAAEKKSQVEKKLSINLHLGRITTQAQLLVLLNFVELRGSEEEDSVESNVQTSERVNNSGRSGWLFRLGWKNGNDELTELDSYDTRLKSVNKMTLFSWSRRHLSFKRPKVTEERNSGGEKTTIRCFSCVNDCREDVESRSSNFSSVDLVTSASGSHQKRKAAETLSESKSKLVDEGLWESKEIMSRDGELKIKTNVFFASFDQCSNKAAGESACTALVAVIAHWLLSHKTSMPTRPVFDNLIIEGSSEWRKLCGNDAYTNLFPDKHFDLETVLHAAVRPISVSRNDSFVGFFSPEKFESLKEAMSFDEIWNDIERISAEYDDQQQRIYIVSWNDHFFVLKVEANTYYVIDTLGERLYEGCNQAYILRFDDSTVMYGKAAQDYNNNNIHEDEDNEDEEETIICRGKECCKEFIKRFLASITIGELEAEEKKGAASYYSLHNRLQIELSFSYLVVSSSLTSSPFSNSSNSESCYSTE